MSEDGSQEPSAAEKRLLELLKHSAQNDDPLPDASDPVGMADLAMKFLDSAARSDVVPEAWQAIMDGQIHPLSAKKFRARDINETRRSWPDIAMRSSMRLAKLKVSHDAALKSMNAAAVKLNEARDELEKEQTAHMQLRMQLLLRELARYANAVLAVGPAWTVLKALTVMPILSDGSVHREDGMNNERIRRKLSAYVDDEFLLELIRVGIAAAIVEFETIYPDRVREGAELDGEDLRMRLSETEKGVFGACINAIRERK